MTERELPIEISFIYIDYNVKIKRNREEFCSGEFVFEKSLDCAINNYSDWKTFFEFMSEKNCEFLDFLKSMHFRKALMEILNSRKINRQQFWDRMKMNVPSIYRCYNKDDSLDMLLKIYNKQSPYIVKKEELNI
jgi:hypothetical protein